MGSPTKSRAPSSATTSKPCGKPKITCDPRSKCPSSSIPHVLGLRRATRQASLQLLPHHHVGPKALHGPLANAEQLHGTKARHKVEDAHGFLTFSIHFLHVVCTFSRIFIPKRRLEPSGSPREELILGIAVEGKHMAVHGAVHAVVVLSSSQDTVRRSAGHRRRSCKSFCAPRRRSRCSTQITEIFLGSAQNAFHSAQATE